MFAALLTAKKEEKEPEIKTIIKKDDNMAMIDQVKFDEWKNIETLNPTILEKCQRESWVTKNDKVRDTFFKEEVIMNQYNGVFDIKNFIFKGEEEHPSLVDLPDDNPIKANPPKIYEPKNKLYMVGYADLSRDMRVKLNVPFEKKADAKKAVRYVKVVDKSNALLTRIMLKKKIKPLKSNMVNMGEMSVNRPVSIDELQERADVQAKLHLKYNENDYAYKQVLLPKRKDSFFDYDSEEDGDEDLENTNNQSNILGGGGLGGLFGGSPKKEEGNVSTGMGNILGGQVKEDKPQGGMLGGLGNMFGGSPKKEEAKKDKPQGGMFGGLGNMFGGSPKKEEAKNDNVEIVIETQKGNDKNGEIVIENQAEHFSLE